LCWHRRPKKKSDYSCGCFAANGLPLPLICCYQAFDLERRFVACLLVAVALYPLSSFSSILQHLHDLFLQNNHLAHTDRAAAYSDVPRLT
jgi:hypothetical protein